MNLIPKPLTEKPNPEEQSIMIEGQWSDIMVIKLPERYRHVVVILTIDNILTKKQASLQKCPKEW
jgi:hypothetical protein